MSTYISTYTGEQIDNGVKNANLMLTSGAADPTTATVGSLGQLYKNTTSGARFKCTEINGSIYTWVPEIQNNSTTTTPGSALDATQGKVLKDAINIAQTRLSESLDNLAESAKSVLPDVSVSTYARVSSLSTKAREGAMNVTIKGNTLKNEITNGNFANGTTGWASTQASLSASGNVITATGNGSAAFISATQTLVASKFKSHKIFVCMKVLVTDANASSCGIIIGKTGGNVYLGQKISPAANQWYYSSGVISFDSSLDTLDVRGYAVYADATTANGKVLQFKDVVCVDMGVDASNPLFAKTVADMGAMTPNYFDSLSSVVAGQIKSTGKNRFDKNNNALVLGTMDASGIDSVSTSRVRTPSLIKVSPNTVYTAFVVNTSYIVDYVYFYTEAGTFISRVSCGYNNSNFTTPASCGAVRLNIAKSTYASLTADEVTIINDGLMVWEGTAKVTYEPYTETVRSLPSATLRSLSNGVCDYIEAMRYVKNCETKTLVGSDITALTTTGTNVDLVNIPLTTFAGVKSQTTGIDSSFFVDGYAPEVDLTTPSTWDLATSIGKWGTGTSSLYIFFAKGTYASLTSAQTALAGTKIIYQLANPVITELLPEPLKSSPSGSIIYECVRREIGTYGTNAAVSNTAAPIRTMRSLWKRLTDGTRIPLSVITGITIATDKLSFTHTSLTSGDNIEWEYEFDSALSTTPLIEYSYVNDADDFPATNLVTNGDFSNGTTGWTAPAGGSFSVSSGEASFTANAQTGRIQIPLSAPTGHVIYRRAYVKSTSNLVGLGATSSVRVAHSGSGNYEWLTQYQVNETMMYISITDGRTSAWDAIYTKYVLSLDLTAIFGAGNEPSKPVMDAIMALYPNSWFDKTVNPLVSLKDIFNLLAPKKQDDWITPTLLNSWVASDTGRTPKYMKDSMGFVHICGAVKSGTLNTIVFGLPAGYRPSASRGFALFSGTGGGGYVDSSGNVIIVSGDVNGAYLDTIIFKAEA